MTTAEPRIAMARSWHDEAELAAVEAVLASGVLTGGPVIEAFEQAVAELVGARHAVAVGSGTAALELALRAHGIGPGDEVVVPTFTYVATAAAVAAVGAVPVLVDVSDDVPTIDPAALAAAVTPRTSAVVAVHLYGHPTDTEAVAAVAARHGLLVIDDAAQALGAADRQVAIGATGTAGLSFHGSKHLSTGEGGMVLTDDPAVAGRVRASRDHGTVGPYLHATLGSNHRLPCMSAAIGEVQASRQVGWLARRREVATRLRAGLGELALVVRPGADPSWASFPLRIGTHRDEVLSSLHDDGIDARAYYPRTLHQQPALDGIARLTDAPVATRSASELLCLPCHPHLTDAEVDRVVAAVLRVAVAPGR